MSYPPPPGAFGNGRAPHPSLPSRPPQSRTGGFKSFGKSTPAASAAPTTYGAAPTTYGANSTTYGALPTTYGAATTTYSNASTTYGTAPSTYGATPPVYGASYPAAAPTTYGPRVPAASAPSTAAMHNPFPTPADEYNADMAAQIAQWQSAYGPRDANTAAIGPTIPESPASSDPNEKKKTVYREGGGKKWQDDSLLEWDPAHLRLFVGNLAGETTDDSLLKAFSRWKSVQKARVIRDKRTTKSKGYGFVSFSDPDDFFQAAKEMNGKYIQSHPVVVRKATTEIKTVNAKDKNKGKWKNNKNNKNIKNKNGSGAGGASGSGYEPGLGASNAGVAKPGQKTKNGLRILG